MNAYAMPKPILEFEFDSAFTTWLILMWPVFLEIWVIKYYMDISLNVNVLKVGQLFFYKLWSKWNDALN